MDIVAFTALNALVDALIVFGLAVFLGAEVIGKVPSLLHTPLMSGSNAISGITVVGALIALGAASGLPAHPLGGVLLGLGVAALALAAVNVAGGFVVTHRMLSKFKGRR